MASLLPDAFRCFGYLEFIYARNLPQRVYVATTGAPAASASLRCSDVERERSLSSSPPGSPSTVSPSLSPTQHANRTLKALGDATYFVLSDFGLSPFWDINSSGTPSPAFAIAKRYRSEVSTGTQHPVWERFPQPLSASLAACTHFTLSMYCCERDSSFARDDTTSGRLAARHTQHTHSGKHSGEQNAVDGGRLNAGDVCIARIRVDVTQLCYVAASVAQADSAVAANLTTDLGWNGGSGGAGADIPFRDAQFSFAIYFMCRDGVFALRDPQQGLCQRATPTTAGDRDGSSVLRAFSFGSSGDEVTWSRSPAGCGKYLNISRPFVPAPSSTSGGDASSSPNATVAAVVTSPPPSLFMPGADGRGADALSYVIDATKMTIGDVRALTSASLGWKYLHELTSARRLEQLTAIETATSTVEGTAGVADEVASAVARVAAEEAREALTVATLTREGLQEAIAARRALLAQQEIALEKLTRSMHAHTDPALEAAVHAQQRQEELVRAQLRSELARARHSVVRCLATIYPVALTSQYGAALRNAKNAKDSIAGHALPFFSVDRGSGGSSRSSALGGGGFASGASGEDAEAAAAYMAGLVATSTDDLREEGLAMAHTAHVLQALAALYGCRLPHPLLMAGTRSRVLLRGDIPPAQAATAITGPDDEKLPLACARAADRPMLRAALRLVVRDAAVLARAMGKQEERVWMCGLRIGAVLHYLMNEW